MLQGAVAQTRWNSLLSPLVWNPGAQYPEDIVGGTEDKLLACHDGNRLGSDDLEGHLPPGLRMKRKWLAGRRIRFPVRSTSYGGQVQLVTAGVVTPTPTCRPGRPTSSRAPPDLSSSIMRSRSFGLGN
jgi:hypothetical protein